MAIDPEEIKQLVREVVLRTLGQTADTSLPSSAGPDFSSNKRQRLLLDADKMRQLPPGSSQEISTETIVTPLAQQIALERHIQLVRQDALPSPANRRAANPNGRIIALGADHGGYPLKELLREMLESDVLGYTVIDCGTNSTESVDYPDYAYAVARLVADGRAWRGIIIDGAGIGSCMAANKVPGVRAAMCYDQATAVNSREHNNANVLTLGAGLIGPNLARQIVTTWLHTDFAGGRHARRVNKIEAIEKRFVK